MLRSLKAPAFVSESGEPIMNSPAGIRTISNVTPLPRGTVSPFPSAGRAAAAAPTLTHVPRKEPRPSGARTDAVKLLLVPACSGVGVHEKLPVWGSIAAPAGAPEIKLVAKPACPLGKVFHRQVEDQFLANPGNGYVDRLEIQGQGASAGARASRPRRRRCDFAGSRGALPGPAARGSPGIARRPQGSALHRQAKDHRTDPPAQAI